MNAMCRSLKMLNVARLNVKAQKLHPDASPEAAGEKGVQKPAGGRAVGRLESRGRTRSSKPKGIAHCQSAQHLGPCVLFPTLLFLDVSVSSSVNKHLPSVYSTPTPVLWGHNNKTMSSPKIYDPATRAVMSGYILRYIMYVYIYVHTYMYTCIQYNELIKLIQKS